MVEPTVRVVKRKAVVPSSVVSAAPVVVRRPAAPAPAVIARAFKNGKAGQLQDSERRKKLEKLMLENIGKTPPLSLEEMMLAAGYAKTTAHAQPPSIVQAARNSDTVQDHLARLQKIREATLTRIELETNTANYGQLAFGLQVLDKSIAMLEGRPTDRVEHTLGEEEREALDDILRMNEEA